MTNATTDHHHNQHGHQVDQDEVAARRRRRAGGANYVPPPAPPTSVRGTGLGDYCPWRHLDELNFTIAWHDAGHCGLTTYSTRTISLRRGMLPAKQRAVLAHELAHVELGPTNSRAGDQRQRLAGRVDEHLAAAIAAFRLIPAWTLEELRELDEANGLEQTAADLEVDVPTVRIALRLVEAGTA